MARKVDVFGGDEEGGTLFENPTFAFEPGVTYLVGCNGSGKTTLMRRVREELDRIDGVAARTFDCSDSNRATEHYLLTGRTDRSATMLCSSEGERMAQALALAFDWMWAQDRDDGVGEIWMMLDSLDSGLDIPNLRMIRGVLENVVGMVGKDLYVMVAANDYALLEDRECLDIRTGETLTFSDWGEYATFCERSRDAKEERYAEESDG